MILIEIYIFVGFFIFANAHNKLMPNLPLGEYRLIFNTFYHCENSKHLPFKINLNVTKNASKVTEIKGNIGGMIPFDDSLTIDGSIASFGVTGGWKPHSMLFVTNNACTKFKSVAGKSWYSAVKAFNVPTENCPIPVGIYTTSGVDTKLFEDNNFPKVYFYGKYKLVLKIKNKENRLQGCFAVELDLVRPWEVKN